MVNDPRFTRRGVSIPEAARRSKRAATGQHSYKFDVFISHSNADRPAVRELTRRLKEHSITVWVDEEQLVPGQPWQAELDEAARSAKSVLIFIGSSGLGPWAQTEIGYGISKQVEDPDFRLIPVLGPGASIEAIPPLLRSLSYIDLRELDASEYDRLEQTLKRKDVADTPPHHYGPKVFLCHAHEDAPRVEQLYYQLQDQGLNPWYDKKSLFIGDDWEEEILKAIEETDFFAICLSPLSLRKRGFVQREIRTAVKEYQNRPHGTAYLLPIRLTECQVPRLKLDANRVLSDLHWVDVFEHDKNAIDAFARGIWTQWNRRNEN